MPDDAVLDGNVSYFAAGDAECFIAAPGDTHVIKDHIAALSNGDCIFATRATLSHSDTNVANNCIVGVTEAPAIAVYGDAIARSSLAENSDSFGGDDAVFDLDHTTNGKYNYAVWF